MSEIAKFICNWTNPALAVLLCVNALTYRGKRGWQTLFGSAAAIGISVELAELGKDYLPYPDPGGFPSGHETFAVATLTCLIWRDRRWIAFAVPMSIVMAAALVVARYHQPVDVVGSVIISPFTTSAVLKGWKRLTSIFGSRGHVK